MINRLCGSAGLYRQPAHTLRWRGDCSACCRPPWSWPPMRSGLGSPDVWSSSSLCAPCARWSCTLHCLRPPSLCFTLFRLLRHDVLSLLSNKTGDCCVWVAFSRGTRMRERGKKVRETERWKRLRESPRLFRRRFGKRNRSSETTGPGLLLSGFRACELTDWNLGSVRSPGVIISGRYFRRPDDSRNVPRAPAASPSPPFLRVVLPHPPPSSPDRSSPSSTLQFLCVSLFLRGLSFSWISMQCAGCNFSTIRPFTLSLLSFTSVFLLPRISSSRFPCRSRYEILTNRRSSRWHLLEHFFFSPSSFYKYFWKIL